MEQPGLVIMIIISKQRCSFVIFRLITPFISHRALVASESPESEIKKSIS